MSFKTPADLAETFQVSEKTILHWRKRYGWPSLKVGNQIRFTDEQFAHIVANATVEPDETSPVAFAVEGQTERSARTRRTA